MERPALNLNLATRPLRNRRLYNAAIRVLAGLIVVLAGLAVFAVVKYGGEASRIKTASAATRQVQNDASLEQKRLDADIDREEKLSRARIELVNGIILRKTFSWAGLLSELEQALPGPSYITGLSPSFTPTRGGRPADAGELARPGRSHGLHHGPDRPWLQGHQGRWRAEGRGRPAAIGVFDNL